MAEGGGVADALAGGRVAGDGVHVATVTIRGTIAVGTAFDPARIADTLALHRRRQNPGPTKCRTTADLVVNHAKPPITEVPHAARASSAGSDTSGKAVRRAPSRTSRDDLARNAAALVDVQALLASPGADRGAVAARAPGPPATAATARGAAAGPTGISHIARQRVPQLAGIGRRQVDLVGGAVEPKETVSSASPPSRSSTSVTTVFCATGESFSIGILRRSKSSREENTVRIITDESRNASRPRPQITPARYRNMRVLPSVFGLTRSSSKNSAMPSSYERNSCSYTQNWPEFRRCGRIRAARRSRPGTSE